MKNISFKPWYFIIFARMKLRKLTNNEIVLILMLVILLALVILSWDRIGPRIREVIELYK